IQQMGINCLPWDDATRELQARVRSLQSWQPDGKWPDISDEFLMENLEEWLSPWLDRISRKDQLKQLKLTEIFLSLLDWPMPQRLNDEAPTHITVPSGSRVRLQYQIDGAPPVLAVRLQELFGLADTPTICQGKIKVMLHLLSPARRPMQVTQDLRGFWDRTYPEVKKELAGRYPKHHWPDDPWSAQATSRIKKKKH
ncbi:MAG: ATP-dependent helicase HrpB, partial [Desulfobulbaceae bacterium]|nr:ATP-dependent helicase HrpB [Desulfobulbaceae bacterium]